MHAILYKAGKSAMQSGTAQSENWILKPSNKHKFIFRFEPTSWVGSESTEKQLELTFADKQSAIKFCKEHNVSYKEIPYFSKNIKPKSYTETICQEVLKKNV